MEKVTIESDDLYLYTYYLFKKDDPKNPVKIGGRLLDFFNENKSYDPNVPYSKPLDVVFKENVPSDYVYKANGSVYLFNMIFHSNKELMNAIVERYNFFHKSKLNVADFDYVAMIAPGDKTKDYGLLKYTYDEPKRTQNPRPEVNKKEKKYEKKKLVPIIFHEDYSNLMRICEQANIKIVPGDILYPRNLLVKVLSAMRYVRENKGKKYAEFYRNLEKKYSSLANLKYDGVYGHSSEREKYLYVADPANDKSDIIETLNSGLTSNKYKTPATFYYNMLSLICQDIRIATLALDQGYSYNPVTKKIGFDDLSVNFQCKTAIRSVQEVLDDIQQNKDSENSKNEETLIKKQNYDINDDSFERFAEEYIENYNIMYGTKITLSDVLAGNELYRKIFEDIQEIYNYKNGDNSRK